MSSPTTLLAGSTQFAKPMMALAAAIYGLFWVPLRALDAAGVSGAWSAFAVYGLSAVIAAPFMVFRWRQLLTADRSLWITAAITGLSIAGYSTAFMLTDVVKVILLYYLTPIWSTILARIVLKVPITPIRLIAIVMGFAGVAVIFHVDERIPLPNNSGDWLAFGAGILWAVAMVRLRVDKRHDSEEMTFVFFLATAFFALCFALGPGPQSAPIPSMAAFTATLPWLVPVVIALFMTSSFLVIWGCRIIDPGLAGLIFMTEITVSTVAAAVLTDEPFGWREITGVVLISAAGLAEIILPTKS